MKFHNQINNKNLRYSIINKHNNYNTCTYIIIMYYNYILLLL